jgi:transcriptional regulator with XRE-family HTH domain
MFGDMLRNRRQELRLGLRDAAERAEIDPGNLSKLERGGLKPPQDERALNRLARALEYDLDGPEAERLRDTAYGENGLVPPDILERDAMARRLPLLLRSINNKQLDEEQLERLIEKIRQA